MISVLYVDDEEALLDICKIFLERSGELKIETESSVHRALEKLSRESFDVIVSDYQMPEMDGIEFLKRIRSDGNTIPFIIFTGRGREEVAVAALKEGADFYLQKGGDPISQFAELINQIKQSVRQRKAESAVIENEQKYRTLYESAHDAIFLMTDDQIIDCNRQTEQLFGRTREEIVGFSPLDLSPSYQLNGSSSYERGMRYIERAMAGEAQSYEWRFIHSNGQIIDAGVSLNRIDLPTGHMLLSIIRDITARKRNEEELNRKTEELSASYEELMSAEEELRDQYEIITQREQALRESEAKLDAIIQGSPIPQFVIDTDHRVLYWNTALTVYSNIPAEEICGTDQQWRAFYPDKRPCLADLLVDGASDMLPVWYGGKDIRQALIRDAYTAVDFFPHMGKNGIWLSFTAAIIRDSSGNVIGAVETLEDITDQKQSSLALIESEARYREIIENLQDVFYRSDTEGRLIMASPSILNVLGYESMDECIGKNIAETFYYNAQDRYAFITAINKTGSISNYETILKRKDGSPVFVSSNSHIYTLPDGTPAGIEGTFRDISSIKEAEQALIDSEGQFRALFSHANDAIFMHRITHDGLPGVFIEVNETACRRLGYTRDEMLHMSPVDIDAPISKEIEKENTENLLKTGHATFEAVHITHDKASIPVEISAHIYEFRGERIVLSIARDISDRKRYESAIHNANKKLNLLSSITRHDILNQLTALTGYLDLSEEVAEGSQIQEYIKKEKKTAEIILRQILFTRDYQTIGIQSPQWQSLKEVILMAAGLHDPGSITISVEINEIEVFADPLLEKVFFNLIDNSLRYGSNLSQIIFSHEITAEGLTIICSDDGGGIPSVEKENIFNRKYFSNTGFGLFLSREILAITNLSIKECGEAGVGARFEIEIPVGNYRLRT
jgi:PAS domain S-box-containing protein